MKTIIGIEKFWTLFIGLGAVWGAMMMWIDPTGVMWGMDLMLELLRAKMPWPVFSSATLFLPVLCCW